MKQVLEPFIGRKIQKGHNILLEPEHQLFIIKIVRKIRALSRRVFAPTANQKS